MQQSVFINDAINDGIELYMKAKNNKDSLDYNRFLCVVIRMLVIIYGEEFINKESQDGFEQNLLKFGFEKENYDSFINSLDKFYKFDKRQQKKAIKKKNKYFDLVQKYLIDMMVAKKNSGIVSNEELISFYDLLFTANSKDFYRKSTAVLLAYNPYEIDDYAKKKNIVVG